MVFTVAGKTGNNGYNDRCGTVLSELVASIEIQWVKVLWANPNGKELVYWFAKHIFFGC